MHAWQYPNEHSYGPRGSCCVVFNVSYGCGVKVYPSTVSQRHSENKTSGGWGRLNQAGKGFKNSHPSNYFPLNFLFYPFL